MLLLKRGSEYRKLQSPLASIFFSSIPPPPNLPCGSDIHEKKLVARKNMVHILGQILLEDHIKSAFSTDILLMLPRTNVRACEKMNAFFVLRHDKAIEKLGFICVADRHPMKSILTFISVSIIVSVDASLREIPR